MNRSPRRRQPNYLVTAIHTVLLAPSFFIAGANVALANPEPPAAYDARSVAMGGTGAAYIDGAAAAFHNPASLDQIDGFVATADLTAVYARGHAPVAGPNSYFEQEPIFVPLGMLGAAYRVSDRIAVGLAGYVVGGAGAEFVDIPQLGYLKSINASAEVSLPISLRITDGLAIGVAPRLVYFMSESSGPQLTPEGAVIQMDQSLSGMTLLAVHAGVFIQPVKPLRLALTYRSKASVELSGDTTLGGQAFATTMNVATPHSFRVGLAYSLLDETLLLATDVKLFLYEESTEMFKQEIDGVGAQVIEARWKNSVTVNLGAEYWVTQSVAARVGYAAAVSATNAEYTTVFDVPPGVLHNISAGVGVKASPMDLDFAAMYGTSRYDAPGSQVTMPGAYDVASLYLVVSATYRN